MRYGGYRFTLIVPVAWGSNRLGYWAAVLGAAGLAVGPALQGSLSNLGWGIAGYVPSVPRR